MCVRLNILPRLLYYFVLFPLTGGSSLAYALQDILIDRRFYRQKYDADKTLAAFSTVIRIEVDLNQLRERLVAVVQETMQPAHVSLWFCHPEPSRERNTRLLPRIDEGESEVP
jgi:hypothetical protein